MKTQILLRSSLAEEGEFEAASIYFPTVRSRTEIEAGSLVIPRYSSLPYYDELEKDVRRLGGTLINTYEQHRWIADFHYYNELRGFTFETWTESTINKAPADIAYVVKGRTNSRKFQWNNSMFAENRRRAVEIGADLYADSMIGTQGILYRRYVPLKKLEEGINGMPMSNEYRFFFLGDSLLASSFYWAIAETVPEGVPAAATNLAKQIAVIAAAHTNFFVLDIAETETGEWVLVEMNCGTMSGLSLIDPIDFYSNLKMAL